MENIEKSYENLIALLKSSEPRLEQASALQKNIMQGIEYQSVNRQKMSIYRLTGMISGVAACLLGVLFIYETAQKQVNLHCNTANEQIHAIRTELAQKISLNAVSNNNLENIKIISSVIRQKQIENKERKQFYASFLGKFN